MKKKYREDLNRHIPQKINEFAQYWGTAGDQQKDADVFLC